MIMKEGAINTIMKILNKILVAVMSIGTLFILFIDFNKNDFSRIFLYLGMLALIIIPTILKKLKLKINHKELGAYNLFILISYFVGGVVNLYYKLAWYDSIVHFLSGIFMYLFGRLLYERFSKTIDKKIIKFIFCLGVASLIAISWEVLEFIIDNILNTNLQRNASTGVVDTMIDLLLATIGSYITLVFDLADRKK